MKSIYSVPACVRYVVIGDPVAHSLSPEMQNAGFAACELAARYGKIHVRGEEMAEFAAFAARTLDGFNITVPHKRAVMPFLSGMTERARRGMSVNTVTCRDGALFGDSTDGFGLTGAIRDAFGLEVRDKRILFVGAGGATRAVAVFLEECGSGEIVFANRTVEHAEALAKLLHMPARAIALADTPALGEAFAGADIVIQSTSCGLHDGDELPFAPELLRRCRGCCFDMIYRDTPFLRAARSCGLPAADGCGMLLHQGAKSFEIWTGIPAPLEAMRSALRTAREARR